MNIININKFFFLIIFALSLSNYFCHAANSESRRELHEKYMQQCRNYHLDIYEHLPVLKNLTSECESVVEIGVRHMFSSWAFLEGLTENNSIKRSYIGIDLVFPPRDELNLAKKLAADNNINFEFIAKNDMLVDLAPVDFMFIDSMHTYCHLTYELEKFSPKVKKYIAMHDTSEPWGYKDDSEYHGNYSEYPAHIDRKKRGLWPAVEDFLIRHPEWSLHERRFNNYGLTILKRNN